MLQPVYILIISLTGIWIILNGLNRFYLVRGVRSRSLSAATARGQLTVSKCSLHYSTTYFNSWPKRLINSTRFNKKNWSLVYDVGVIIGLLGFVVAQMILLWSTWQSCRAFYAVAWTEDTIQQIVRRSIMKRSVVTEATPSNTLVLRPLVSY
jgi:hypothetical protein